MPHRPTSAPARLAALLLIAAAAPGCELLGLSEAEIAPTEPGAEGGAPSAPPRPAPAPGAVLEDQDYERPQYPDSSRRNPFRPVADVLVPQSSVDELAPRPTEPLEAYSIGQLELVAIISETAIPKAMFVDPDGLGHTVKRGDRIGRQGGVVADIRDNEIDISEAETELAAGAARVRTVRLREVAIASNLGSDLSDQERSALQRLLESEEGRRAVRDELRGQLPPGGASPGAPGFDRTPSRRPGAGLAPPSFAPSSQRR